MIMRYLIEYTGKDEDPTLVGEKIQTRGDDERFPTFRLDDGRVIGCAQERVSPLNIAGTDFAVAD